jgi:sugar-specific transcriptional regulator TrmB/DNA-binding CsgD family transcriptional regulator
VLEAAGVEPLEERVYRLLVGVRDADAGVVGDRLGLPADVAGELLESLHVKGLVSRVSATPARFVPTPPDVALGPVLLRRQEALESARMGITELAEEYRLSARSRDADQLVEVIVGEASVRQQVLNVARNASEELRWFCRTGQEMAPVEETAAIFARGVRVRIIYERARLEEPGVMATVAEIASQGGQVRATSLLPVRLAIADSRVGICTLLPGGAAPSAGPAAEAGAGPAGQATAGPAAEPGSGPAAEASSAGASTAGALAGGGGVTAALVRGSSLLEALEALFERYWEISSPLRAGPGEEGGPLADDDRYLLSLLIAGMADKAIASQLRISQRTVQRRIYQLMERAGATTRMQLAWQVADRGWLT